MSTPTTPAAPAANPIAQEAQVFNDVKAIINMIFPIINMIPFVPQDIKTKMNDV